MGKTFNDLMISFTPTIFTWAFYCDFIKAEKNAFDVKVQLNLLNSLLGEKNIDEKFISLIREYPRVKNVLPLLIAVRDAPQFIMQEIDTVYKIDHLFKVKHLINAQDEELLLNFFNTS
jgi:type II restriction enzyme